jgi:hypothetical protein
LLRQSGFILIALSTAALDAGFTQIRTRTIPLDATSEMHFRNVKAERVTYKGRAALRGSSKPSKRRAARRFE